MSNKVKPAWPEHISISGIPLDNPVLPIGKCWNILKVLVTVGVPLFAVCALAYSGLSASHKQMLQVQSLKLELEHTETVCELIRYLHNEGSLSCLLRNKNSSSDMKLVASLNFMRARTDEAVIDLANHMVNVGKSDEHSNAVTNELSNIRLQIDSKDGTPCKNLILRYFKLNTVLIEQLMNEFRTSSEGKLWAVIQATYLLALSENHLALQRALGDSFFTTGMLNPDDYILYYRSSGAQKVMLDLSLGELPAARQAFDESLEQTQDLMINITMMEQQFLTNNLSQPDDVTAQHWFESQTALQVHRDKAANELQDFINATLGDRADDLQSQFGWTLGITLICIVICPTFGILYAYHTHRLDNLSVKTRKLWVEEKKTAHLLYQLLPRTVADQLLQGKQVQPETYHSVSVFFSDVVGFTSLAAKSSPMQVVELLNSFYTEFDTILDCHECYKVETIGDAYLVVSGLPERNEPEHSAQMCLVALDILQACSKFCIPHMDGENLLVRIGIHTGPCVAGVVGLKTPKYCLFGDTVNTASRMESSGAAMRAHLSEATAAHIQEHHRSFKLQCRGSSDIKGKGSMTTYWLIGNKEHPYKVDLDQAEQMYHTARYWRYEIWLGD